MNEKDLLKPSEVARILHVDNHTVSNWIRSGAIESVDVDGRKYIRREVVERITNANKSQDED